MSRQMSGLSYPGRSSSSRLIIRILAPVTIKQRDDNGEDTAEKKVLFRTVAVFDVSQTDGPAIERPAVQPMTGDSHAAYLRPLEVLAHSLGFSVSYENLSEGLGGYCDATMKHIAVNKNEAVNQQVRVLIHEIAHALGVGYEEYGREQAEVLVETATFIVATSIGLDTTGSSIPYVAHWGAADAVKAIETFASVVDKLARTIEKAVKDAEVAA